MIEQMLDGADMGCVSQATAQDAWVCCAETFVSIAWTAGRLLT